MVGSEHSSTRTPCESLSLNLIDPNPYNSRLESSPLELDQITRSMEQLGLLSPVMVRPKRASGRYELVFGHRRVEAARRLGWSQISAEVKPLDDEEMIKLSLAENDARENLSDYEKGLCFSKLNKEFGKTLGQIGNMVGFSESHVSNFVRMAELLDQAAVSRDPKLLSDLCSISEHHARILLRIPDSRERQRMLRLVVSDKLSVRDLQRMLQRFRSWFPNCIERTKSRGDFSPDLSSKKSLRFSPNDDLEEINKVVLSEFRLPRERDFDSFARLHEFERGFSIFASNPPLTRFDDHLAVEQERRWFFGDATQLSADIRDMRVQLYEKFAVVTLCVDHRGRMGDKQVEMSVRGTLVLSNSESSWRIVHEHWSNENFHETREDKTLPGHGAVVTSSIQSH
jgi:ParB/RepB/Spo0J family partition protein